MGNREQEDKKRKLHVETKQQAMMDEHAIFFLDGWLWSQTLGLQMICELRRMPNSGYKTKGKAQSDDYKRDSIYILILVLSVLERL